jgi:hypothetical protein
MSTHKPRGKMTWYVQCPGCGDPVPAGDMMSLPMRTGWALCPECWLALQAEAETALVVGPRHAALCALVPVAP